jgi:tRNA G18 (ribose-2'-O)-methylase SpoU
MATIEPVEDPRDPRLADYRSARDPAWRQRTGLFLAESALVVRRLLTDSPFRARAILVTPALLDGLRDVLDRAEDGPVVHVAGHSVQRELMGFNFHRGCLALAERGAGPPPGALLARGAPLLLVLDDVADPDNVGALFRNARAFGAGGALLSPGTADPLYPKAIRVSVAATLSLPHARLARWPEDLADVRAAGYTLVALSPDGTRDVATLAALRGRAALVAGSEGHGLAPGVRAAADVVVRVAMAPGVDSLNVAVAAAIALHHLAGRG